jgi:hypothetical protein
MDVSVQHSGGQVRTPIARSSRQTLHLRVGESHRVSFGILRGRPSARISFRKHIKSPILATSVALDSPCYSATVGWNAPFPSSTVAQTPLSPIADEAH